ncbi:MAG: PD40 domain-containing protein [candidate division Zixibacteria bacterium]|nr:PD40 domain-containing protein [candidate division Zixibacteria bacterium]
MLRLRRVHCAGLGVLLLLVSAATAGAKTGDIIARLGPGTNPQWSPDGNLIAFANEGSIWVMNADGSGVRSMVANGEVGRYAWASDKRLILTSDYSPKARRDSVRFFDVALVRSKADKGAAIVPASSPRLLATAVAQRRPRHIITGPSRLADGTVGYFDCAGSPINPGHFRPLSFGSADTTLWHRMRRVVVLEDGKEFATGFGDIWLVPVDVGDGPGRRLTTGRNFRSVCTSPGGVRISAYDTERNNLVFMDSSGTEILPGSGSISRETIGCLGGTAYLEWAPDAGKFAQLVAIEEDEIQVGEVLSVFDFGSGISTVILSSDSGFTGIGTPSWSPSGDRLAVSTGTSGILVLEVR